MMFFFKQIYVMTKISNIFWSGGGEEDKGTITLKCLSYCNASLSNINFQKTIFSFNDSHGHGFKIISQLSVFLFEKQNPFFLHILKMRLGNVVHKNMVHVTISP